MLRAVLEQDLHADTDAEHRAPTGQPSPDDLVTVDRAETLHARGERPDPGDDQAVGVHCRLSVGRQGHLGAGPLQGANGRPEVAGAVVEDGDLGRGSGGGGRAQSEPLVEGTPVSRGSSATASRSARATALN